MKDEQGKHDTMPERQLEICAETLQACDAANAGGADRIELCAALGQGGVSPSRGLLAEALFAVRIPVHVLIRPRTGDFQYSPAEFRAVCRDAEDALAAGAAGLVVGTLTPGHEIDARSLAELIRRSNGRPVTFHRAFDQVQNLPQALETLIDLGCDRVLTSGGSPTVDAGIICLQDLVAQARGRIRIAAGGGVTFENAARLAAVPGLDLHASLRSKNIVPAADPLWTVERGTLPVEAVRALTRIVHGATHRSLASTFARAT